MPRRRLLAELNRTFRVTKPADRPASAFEPRRYRAVRAAVPASAFLGGVGEFIGPYLAHSDGDPAWQRVSSGREVGVFWTEVGAAARYPAARLHATCGSGATAP